MTRVGDEACFVSYLGLPNDIKSGVNESWNQPQPTRQIMYRQVISKSLKSSIPSTAASGRRFASSNAARSGGESYVHATPPKDPSTPIPDERITPPDHGEAPGAFPTSALYRQHPKLENESPLVQGMTKAKEHPSSSSNTPAHPGTTREGLGRAGVLEKDESGVGWSSAVRHRSAPGEMQQGGDGGLGLMDKKKGTKS